MLPGKIRILPVILFLFFAALFPAFGNGNIRLILNDQTGTFSLYYLSDPEKTRYEPLLNAEDPRSSYFSVSFNGNVHRLGLSPEFTTTIEQLNGYPALVFESDSLTITNIFTPIKTVSAQNVNGIKLTVTIMNTSYCHAMVGLRLLLDTHLGEDRRRIPFLTNNRLVRGETLLDKANGEKFWITRGRNTSLMGSIVNPFDANDKEPDVVHIANWKRLDEVPWDLGIVEGRSFNYFPYWGGDSAVCYYYEPALLESGSSVTYTIFLTTEDIEWYSPASNVVIDTSRILERTAGGSALNAADTASGSMGNNEDDMALLLRMQELLRQFIAGEIYLDEHDLTEIENTISRLRTGLHQR
jgi:hypothetical protein